MSRRILRAAGVAALLAIAALVGAVVDPTPPARGEPSVAADARETTTRANWRVIDGDTFEDLGTGDRYRLENIDTPETGSRARCAAERALGDRATQRARAIIAGADQVDVRRTGRIDRYNRIIAFFSVDGRDLGEWMVAEGLARPWRGRREAWCDAQGNLVAFGN